MIVLKYPTSERELNQLIEYLNFHLINKQIIELNKKLDMLILNYYKKIAII